DALVESLLVLEVSPTDAAQLNEAFRLIHSVKGSSAMMGLDGITVLTHHLENHFERLRSGLTELDQSAMGLILRCIDFLRECNSRSRRGSPRGSPPERGEDPTALAAAPPPPAAAPRGPAPAAVEVAKTVAKVAETSAGHAEDSVEAPAIGTHTSSATPSPVAA